MDFQLNEEQTLLRDSVVRWVAERGQAADAGAGDAPSARWREMAGFGWLAMTLPDAYGGLGQGLVAQGRTISETIEIAKDIAKKLIEAKESNISHLKLAKESFDYPLVIGF